ncbi:MAG: hypothetical protein Kow00124_26010 [Anaerolineae bacterium]
MLAQVHQPSFIRIVLIEDNDTTQSLLDRYFSIEDDIVVIGKASRGWDGLELVRKLQPDLVLTDYNLPDISGTLIASTLHTKMPDVAVVVMSVDNDPRLADQSRQSGARAFVVKDGDPEPILNAIRRYAC